MTDEKLTERVNEMYEVVEGQFIRKTSSTHYKKGDVAGASGNAGLYIKIDGKKYMAHKLVWLLEYGKYTTDMLIHKDGNKFNNKLDNITLRHTTTAKKEKAKAKAERTRLVAEMQEAIANGYDDLEYTAINIGGANKSKLESIGYKFPYGTEFIWLVKNEDLIKIEANTRIKVKCKCGDVRTTKAYRGNLLCRSCSNRDETLTDDERVDRRKVKGYMQWSYEVKERDNFTCVTCGNTKRRLHSHHLESYRANKELRTEVSNGVCLCDKCHKGFHKEFGYGNNTAVQFEEYLHNRKDK